MRLRLVFLSLGIVTILPAQTADLVVKNAKIYTVDAKNPRATAIAVRNGKIAAVGNELKALEGPKTRILDAKGATIVPGLIDSHGHLEGLGSSLEILDLRGVTSGAEIAAKVKAAAAKAAPGEWIVGRGWDQNLWVTKQFPTTDALTQAAPKNPVALTRIDGHATWANRAALDAADINQNTKDPAGGRIIRDAQGKPAGVLVDTAQNLVRRKIPAASPEQVHRQLARALEECARLGLTSVHDAGVGNAEIAAYHSLLAEGTMPIRVYAMLANEPALVATWLARGPEIGDFLTIRSIKAYADGALGSRGAALLAPYADEKSASGLMITGKDAIENVAVKAAARGFQVNTHAIGDRGNHETLDAYAAALKGPNDKLVPLSTFASLKKKTGPRSLNRFQQFNAVKISGVAIRPLDDALRFLEGEAAKILPKGYKLDYTGESRQLRVEASKFLPAFTLALVLIFLVLAAQFNSFRDPLIILLGSVPLAMFGALMFSFLKMPGHNMEFFTNGWTTTLNIYSQVGLVTLIGLVSKNGILIVEFANQLQRGGMTRLQAAREAAMIRLRPVLMTSAATICGHFPLTLVSGAGAAARNSIGITIVAGMALGTIFTLLVIPSIYVLLAKEHGNDLRHAPKQDFELADLGEADIPEGVEAGAK